MAYMRHQTIICTSELDPCLELAHENAVRFGLQDLMTPILPSRINGIRSFVILPDGSELGWQEAEIAEAQRQQFIEWLSAYRYGDGSSPIYWVVVQYGDDDMETKILRHSDEIASGDGYTGPTSAERNI